MKSQSARRWNYCARRAATVFKVFVFDAAAMERGAIVYACDRDNLDEGALRRAMAI